MATYAELYSLGVADSPLLNRIAVGAAKKAQALLVGATPTAAEVAWAVATLEAPVSRARPLLYFALAANSSLTVSQIQNASDAALQANIDTAANAWIAGGVL